MEGNEYYTKIHDELSKYGVDKLTAAQMGGLECGKCHNNQIYIKCKKTKNTGKVLKS
jgi:hypothetical protein